MLAEFEQRLADVLGSRLPAPFTGRVEIAPGSAPSNQVRLIVGVQSTELLTADFQAHRDVQLPGSPNFRRVVKLRCTVGVQAHTNRGRADQVQILDAALFQLDASDFRNGGALADGDDPGFLIQKLEIRGSSAPFAPDAENPMAITLLAEGWFWPVGIPEQAGDAIREMLIRAGFLPMQLLPANPPLVAGGAPVELTLRLSTTGTVRLRGAAEPENLPFGSLALVLRDAGARPGAGTLTGGAAGVDDVRLVTLADGAATITYVPPAQPAVDFLVVALEDGSGGQGTPLARFRLDVREG